MFTLLTPVHVQTMQWLFDNPRMCERVHVIVCDTQDEREPKNTWSNFANDNFVITVQKHSQNATSGPDFYFVISVFFFISKLFIAMWWVHRTKKELVRGFFVFLRYKRIFVISVYVISVPHCIFNESCWQFINVSRSALILSKFWIILIL